MVSFEIFVKAMPPSLSELKVTPSFCFAFKIPDDVTASSTYIYFLVFKLKLGFSVMGALKGLGYAHPTANFRHETCQK